MPVEYPEDKQERSDLFWAFITAKYTARGAHIAARRTPLPRRRKNSLGKLPLPCDFPSLSFTAQPPIFIISRGASFRISIKSFPFLLKHTLAHPSGARVGELMQPAARPSRACCIAATVCSMQMVQSQPQPQSIHSPCHSILVQSICNIEIFLSA